MTLFHLTTKLKEYLTLSEFKKVKAAYDFSKKMHSGQMRKSGEPYISHPLAVAEICANWKLDAQAIMAALLHDVMEDQNVKKEELIRRFGTSVASLVDGLSKLEKIEFQNHIEAQAENFRKMLLAMARDVRVILVKLADRLHNMRTLSSMPQEKKRRIANETLEVYVPIAHRLGLNNIYCELQELTFLHLFPLRYKILLKAVKSARGNRSEIVTKILESITNNLIVTGIPAQVDGREKTLYSIYCKMRNKHLSFSQVLDVYGFRIIVNNLTNCYIVLGALHSLFKPMLGKFKDYIAIPKLNGYQSLHTTLIGPYGTPVEFQIRTQDMHKVAESGVAAHWLYKNDEKEEKSLTALQQHTHTWLQSLLDIQKQTGDSAEFLEHVKVDLFPDSVYVFTPKSKIIALPRGATALDFAYNIHTDIGDQAISVIINHESASLPTELHNGDVVEIISSLTSRPNPNWLNYVRTGKARSAIRHRLRMVTLTESQELGKRLLNNAMNTFGFELNLSSVLIGRLLNESNVKTIDELYADIGIGTRMANLVARHIINMIENQVSTIAPLLNNTKKYISSKNKRGPIIINGNEDTTTIELASCCLPIPGDKLLGYFKYNQVLAVHINDCENAKRYCEKRSNRFVQVTWSNNLLHRHFECRITIFANNQKSILAHIAAKIGKSDAPIVSATINDEGNSSMVHIRFIIQVENRIHLARTIRNIRSIKSITHILRERTSFENTLYYFKQKQFI